MLGQKEARLEHLRNIRGLQIAWNWTAVIVSSIVLKAVCPVQAKAALLLCINAGFTDLSANSGLSRYLAADCCQERLIHWNCKEAFSRGMWALHLRLLAQPFLHGDFPCVVLLLG